MQTNRITVKEVSASWCWLHHIHPLENTEGVGFRWLFDGLGEEGVSPAVGSSSSWRCMTTVKQLHGSSHHVSTANELDYMSPPEACSV